MESDIKKDRIYAPSQDIVTREIEGEFIIIPLSSGIGDIENELYAMNKSGRAIWNCLNGKATLQQIIEELKKEYNEDEKELAGDVLGLISELYKRKIVIEVKNG